MRTSNAMLIHHLLARIKITLAQVTCRARPIRLARLGAIAALAALLVAPFYSASVASSAGRSGGLKSATPLSAKAGQAAALPVIRAAQGFSLSTQSGGETVETFAADCVTPKTVFALGETVCVKVSGAPLGSPAPRRIVWTSANYWVRKNSTFVTADPQSDSFTLPSTATSSVGSGVGARTIDNRGTWRISSNSTVTGGLVAETFITVRDPQNASVDLSVLKIGPTRATPGGLIVYTVKVTNNGPDSASNVQLTDTVPADTTFVSETQDDGPTFTCSNPTPGTTGTSTCTIASLAKGEEAFFTFTYQVDSGATGGTVITNTATVLTTSTSTAELHAEDNTSSTAATVAAGATAASCTITCPADISVANDAGQCGAVVNYPAPTTSGCSSDPPICTPPSGSFFHSGSTTVNCTAQGLTSDPCSFTVTVNNTTPIDITCPANITVNETAPGSGSAIVNYPAPTTNCPGTPVTCEPASGTSFEVGATTVTCTADAGTNNTDTCTFTVTVNSTNCTITCPANITKDNDPNQCGAVVTYAAPTTTGSCGDVTCDHASGSFFPVGTTTVTCSNGASSSCSFTVTVEDTQGPTLTNTLPPSGPPPSDPDDAPPVRCRADITVTGNANGEAVVTFATPTATDNCPGVAVVCSPPSGSVFTLGTTAVVCIAEDAAGNTNSCSFRVTVTGTPCTIVSCPANITVPAEPLLCGAVVSYAPPTTTGNCGGDPPDCTPDVGAFFPVGTTTVTCVAEVGQCSFTVTVTNPNPVVTITGPASGSLYTVGTAVSFNGTFTDAGGGTHTATWSFDSLTQAATVVEPDNLAQAPGTANTTYTFNTPGVYQLKLTVNDSCGGSGFADSIGDLIAQIVVYDPNGGFVTGGGWINSPAGAYRPDTSLTGKASFGFVSKYQQGASPPTGSTEFQFKAASLNFKSTSYEFLVIAGARAQFKGTGTINGAGNYGFLLTAIDGQVSGGGGVDKFRMKIWNKNNNDTLVYDNQFGAGDDDNPTTSLGGGSIVIHKN